MAAAVWCILQVVMIKYCITNNSALPWWWLLPAYFLAGLVVNLLLPLPVVVIIIIIACQTSSSSPFIPAVSKMPAPVGGHVCALSSWS